MYAKCETRLLRRDSQEVGLEAAILERVRNSSLVKRGGADNVRGLKHTAEDRDNAGYGRGAFRMRRRWAVRFIGACGSANAGMSSEK